MQTRILLLLALSLITLGLFGCGGSKDTEAAPATGASSTAATPDATANGGTQKPKDNLSAAPAMGANPDYNSGLGTKAK